MAKVPWWYCLVREWRQRAFLETHHWPPEISMTFAGLDISPNSSNTGPANAATLNHA